jgi:predicted amidohydrolase YtcJ
MARDLLVVGRIHTLDPRRPIVEALRIRDGVVARMGSAGECGAAGGTLRVPCAIPGLQDAHGHPYLLGRTAEDVPLADAASEAECVARVVARAADLAPDAWLRGRGWDQNRWPGARFPTARALDAAVPGRRVVLERIDGHAAWVSGPALAAAGIRAETPDPPGGRILRDEHGAPSGVLVDHAQDLVLGAIPKPSPAELDRTLLAGLHVLRRSGLTEIHDAGATPRLLASYRRLAARGLLPVRVYAMIDGQCPPDELDRRIAERGPAQQGLLAVRAVKLFADGALGSRGAALLEPYADDPSTSGLLLLDPRDLRERVLRIAHAGLQPAVHAIGDRACREVLGAFAHAADALPPGAFARLRPRVEHLEVIAPGDLPLLRGTGAIASMQPVHATSDAAWLEARLGPARLDRVAPWRTLLDAGVPLAFGSDVPVEACDPRAGLHAAEARTPRGWDRPFTPGERLRRAEALAGFTSGAAWAAFAEGRRGMLREGADADLTLLADDPLELPADALPGMRILGALVAGEE